jgi:uncharacterized protein YcgI (DUF1989 family)
MRAEMDVVMAVTACPDDAPYNGGYPKALKIEVWGKTGEGGSDARAPPVGGQVMTAIRPS